MAGLGLAAADVTKVRTSAEGPEFPLGSKVKVIVEKGDERLIQEYVYVKATAALAQGKTYPIGDGSTCGTGVAATDLGEYAAIPQVAIASGGFGWALIDGPADYIFVLSAAAADTALYTSATAGALDDTSTSQARAEGLVIIDAEATANGNVAGHVVGPLKIAGAAS